MDRWAPRERTDLPCGCGQGTRLQRFSPLNGIECLYCGLEVSGFEFEDVAIEAWMRVHDIEWEFPDGRVTANDS